MSQLDQLSVGTIEWLSLIRYQLMVAAEQARLAKPLSSLAINTIQDAVESALALVVQDKGGDVRNRPDFMQLFDAVTIHGRDSKILSSFRPAMQAMNNARVSYKHHGNPPDEATVRRHLARSEDFVRTLVDEVFGVRLDEVSLLTFIRLEGARGYLEQAQDHWGKSEFPGAMECLRLAFDLIIKDYASRKQWSPGRTLFLTKPSFYPSVIELRKSGLERIDEWLQNLDKWVRYVALGIDMRRYAFFDAYTPSVTYALGGNHFAYHRNEVQITEEVFARCFKFVVDTGLSLAQDDFDFDLWAARRAATSAEAVADVVEDVR